MSVEMILLPLFVEVILTFVLWSWMATLRTRDLLRARCGRTSCSGLPRCGRAISARVVREEDIALREPNWSKPALQVQYSFSNQFELPVLFYVLTILAYVTHHAGTLFVVLAWVFVIFRVLQAYVHVTNNNVRLRGMFFGISALALAIMWIVFIVQILTGCRPAHRCSCGDLYRRGADAR